MPKRTAQESKSILSELAADLFGDDEADRRDKFVHDGMERMGYKRRVEWDDADEESSSGKDSGNMFGGPRASEHRRERRENSRGGSIYD